MQEAAERRHMDIVHYLRDGISDVRKYNWGKPEQAPHQQVEGGLLILSYVFHMSVYTAIAGRMWTIIIK